MFPKSVLMFLAPLAGAKIIHRPCSPLDLAKRRKYRSLVYELRLKVGNSLRQASRLLLLVVLTQVSENLAMAFRPMQ
jgi:hypothetical protein